LISAWVENHDVALDRWQGPFVVHFAQARTIAAGDATGFSAMPAAGSVMIDLTSRT
jgi:hypothetical protein